MPVPPTSAMWSAVCSIVGRGLLPNAVTGQHAVQTLCREREGAVDLRANDWQC
jgi:hypothetical protein